MAGCVIPYEYHRRNDRVTRQRAPTDIEHRAALARDPRWKMKRFETGQRAPYGIYVAPRAMDIRLVGADGEVLEGRRGASYVHLPTWMVVALGPALGGVFVMAFPLLVIAGAITMLGAVVARKVTGRHAYVARGGWAPAAAFFKGDGTEGAKAEAAPELAQLEAEVAARAANEKQDNT